MNKKHRLTEAAALALMAFPLSGQAQADYAYEQVDFPGDPATQLFGINQPGIAVGNGFSLNAQGTLEEKPFTYEAKQGAFTAIDPVAGFQSTAILGINNRGDLVGSVVDSANVESGFIRDHMGIETIFDHPDAAGFTQARGVNSRGLVTGFRDTNDLGSNFTGFIYDPASATFTDIVPSVRTIAQGINSRGDVVGSAVFPGDADPCNPGASAAGTVRYGWLRTQEGAVSYFSVNGMQTSARGINDAGTVTGFVTTNALSNKSSGFVVELDGTQCQSITLAAEHLLEAPDAFATFPQGITNSGVVSGNYWGQDGFTHGFIATPE